MKNKFISLFVLIILMPFICLPALQVGSSSNNISYEKDSTELPGKYNGYTLLPNGWRLSPVGDQVNIGELPLNMVVTNDGRYVITTNSGMGENSLSVIDVKAQKEIQRINIDKTWYGLAFNNDDSELFVSGGNNNCIYIYTFDSGNLPAAQAGLSLRDSIVLGNRVPKQRISVSGLNYVKSKNLLLAVSKESDSLYVCDIAAKKLINAIPLNGECYDVKTDGKGAYAYVSLWGQSSIAEIDLNALKVTNIIKTGDHPCQLIITKDGSRLFVANANNNSVSVIDLNSKKEIERINSALTPDAPFGSTTNAICFNLDESILIVANADNNYLALFDISNPLMSKSIGFIPVGWYPTAVQVIKNTSQILVANGKGLTSLPNPKGPLSLKRKRGDEEQYIGKLFKGTLSIINFPHENQLSKYSKMVYDNTPYTHKNKYRLDNQNIIPAKHGKTGSNKITHVFYIIKENRTYDQIFGDMTEGNGDSTLCFFPENITPNEHKLARVFTLYDNFYADAEVSADGHNWSTAAYATDYVEKNWPVNYGGRGQRYNFEGGYPLAAPSSGYIWDNLIRHNKTLRNYGEFTSELKGSKDLYAANDDDLKPYTCPTFPGWNLEISDVTRFELWKKDFEKFERTGSLPNLCIMRLPNDHTWGTHKGKPTPQAYVAQNDYALGLIVQTISQSKFWKNSIIFVLEDDAQNGSDHVDAHRSTLLVIGPYVKRHFVDHTMYSTSSVLKTIELILGLPPMTQFDLSAAPILHSITNDADSESYNAVKPLIDIYKMNTAESYGSAECEHLNFTVEDAVPERIFNEILWKAIKGKDSKVPPPVRSAFVKVREKNDKDDE